MRSEDLTARFWSAILALTTKKGLHNDQQDSVHVPHTRGRSGGHDG